MSDNQQPNQYDAVLGGQNQPSEGAAVLGGIEGVKLRLKNPNPGVRITALHQALNYGEGGKDLVIAFLKDEFPQVQAKAYSLLIPLSEQKVKQALQEFNPDNLKLELIEVVTVSEKGEIIKNQQRLAKYFVENLGNRIDLEMAYIPGSTFLMGAPETEKGSSCKEYPQHKVKVQQFYMGKFPITQVQWQAVALLPKVERNLKLYPSYFKGRDRPVEQVLWLDIMEFLARLSKATGKEYRLPSEAEWEYACRAGTKTPFHYGETITSNLANYRADYMYEDERNIYASEPKGEFRAQNIPVGQFPPNNLGLYDMHGNIWELCQDIWHDNYEEAPRDASAWINDDKNKYTQRVFRGGSNFDNAEYCRSAYRYGESPEIVTCLAGFRVACDIF